MRVVRLVGAWITVVVAVVGWILLVPLLNVLGAILKRLGVVSGTDRSPREGVPVEAARASPRGKPRRRIDWPSLLPRR